jgi:hypothetical protein
MKKIILLLLISNSLLANYVYELSDFYDGKDEIQTPAQLLLHLNMTTSDIMQFNCNSTKRDQLFTIFANPNIDKSSLKVEDKNKVTYTYLKRNLYKNGKLYKTKRREIFLNQTLKSLAVLEKTNIGNKLIQKMQESPYPLIITNSTRSYFNPKYVKDRYKNLWNEAQFVRMMDTQTPHFFDKIRFKKIGAGGRIYWNYKSKSTSIESDDETRVTNASVVLAHEMYHAYDSVRGLLDTRYVKSKELESIGLLEYRASFMENQIRRELGFKYRKFYSSPIDYSSPGLLDKNQQPIYLESGCISWLK